MDARYSALMNKVLISNYWGEVVTAEVLARLLEGEVPDGARAALERLLSDEKRHAEKVRGLLLSRGEDPLKADRTAFAYLGLFEDYGLRPKEQLPFLAEFERLSGPTFGGLVRVARKVDDAELVKVYAEILRDEVGHSRVLDSCLPESEKKSAVRDEALRRMRQVMNWDYMRLYLEFPLPHAPVKPPKSEPRG